MKLRRSHKNYAHLTERAEEAAASLPSCHAAALPGLLQAIIDLHLRAADYGAPNERAEARARAGQAAAQLALVLARPEHTPSRN